MKNLFCRFSSAVITTFCLLGLSAASGPKSKIELQIGIVQRFGETPTDKLQLSPTRGDRLKLIFPQGNSQQVLITQNPVNLEILTQTLSQPVVEEVVVLGIYGTFETAEDSAQHWRSRGIEVEIAQPGTWQVWAKRDVYSTPLLRRLLLQSLEAAGEDSAYLDTKVLSQVPRVSWVVDGHRYSQDQLEISTDKNLIRVNQRLYSGQMNLQPNAYGTYTLVNDVSLETYVRGVLPYEIGTNAPMAALEAQAIIARTYVLRNLRRFAVDNYQLCADPHCQVYEGLNGVTANTDRAIAVTQGMVLTYHQELVDALYSSTTGGVTASFSDIWNGADRPYLRPVVDVPTNIWNLSQQSLADEKNFEKFISLKTGFNESGRDTFRWHRQSTIGDITKYLHKFLLVKKSPYAKLKSIQGMAVIKRSPSGRILELAVKTDIGILTLHKDEIRSAFAAPTSTLFYLQPLNQGQSNLWGYAFIGGGLGHGVGLSQTGAQNLAKLGWTSGKILQFYYPGTEIQLLSNKIKPFN